MLNMEKITLDNGLKLVIKKTARKNCCDNSRTLVKCLKTISAKYNTGDFLGKGKRNNEKKCHNGRSRNNHL